MQNAWIYGSGVGCGVLIASGDVPSAFVSALIVTALATALKPRKQLPSDNRSDDDAALARGVCPDCGSSDLYLGPSGGLSVNVLCDACDAEFNVAALPDGPHLIERLGHADEQRKKVYGC